MKWFLVVFILMCLGRVYAQDTSGVRFTEIKTDTPAAAQRPDVTGTTPIAATARTAATGTPKTARQGTAGTSKTVRPATTGRMAPGWTIFLEGMAGGLAALLMPCIFPMLPMTVSFFTKRAGKRGGVRKAVIYGLSIIGIYVTLGLAVTAMFGADALNNLSTNGVFNLAFFLLLVVFAASFLGGFELSLPSSWVNKVDEGSGRQGLPGIFFMAATLAVVSFSCTGPIIGTLLVQTATTGALLAPAVGMLGFSFALALPFTLFALFPGWLSRLPKSGGWLNSIKVVLGFLELALALKFLSNVDLAYHWHWFDREVFLALWIVIFGLMGFYLLGKLPFRHDSPLPYVPVPRIMTAIVVFSFTLYMVPGLWGAPLKAISAFLPPMSTQDFDLSGGVSAAAAGPSAHKYANLFDRPKGFDPYFDYAEALSYAQRAHKPIMIDFTGHACVNCRKMEANIWPDPAVARRINDNYVLVQLYVDDKTDLDSAENTPEGRLLRTLGNKWSYLQTSRFGANSQPYYVLMDPGTELPLAPPQGANYDPKEYLTYLDSGVAAFQAK